MLKIRKIQVPTTVVYDISVPDTESFFANNVLVHNCNEIHLVTDENRTAVCCLSSVNAEYFDEWKNDKLFLKDVAEMLDNVLQKFIDDAPDTIARARYSAMRERSIGIGLLGLHSYFQKHMIPFESAMATGANIRIFKHIRTQLDIANAKLGAERGSNPDYLEANGLDAPPRRFTHMMAIAPNACQSKENTIQTVDGIMSVQDFLVGGGLDVLAVESTGEKQWVKLSHPIQVPTLDTIKTVDTVWYNGVEEVFEIEFEDGVTYKYTENHRLLVRTVTGDTEWVRVGDLTGDEDIVNCYE